MSDESTGEFNLHAAADEIIASESDSSPAQVDGSSQSAGQSEQDSQQAAGNNELSPEDILNNVAKEQGDPNALKDVLEKINAIGAIHAGAPIKVDSPEKLKELLEKGAGFYAKTEEHANLVKAKEAEFLQRDTQLKEREGQFAQREEQLQSTVNQHQLMFGILSKLQSSDPELFQHLDALYRAEEAEFARQNAYAGKFQTELQARDAKINSLFEKINQKETSEIRGGWEKELSEVQSAHAAALSKLGVKGNWDKVKEAWAADSTGKMSVKEAFYAVHGEEIRKAHESQLKLLQTKNKTAKNLVSRSGVGPGERGGEEVKQYRTGDYGSILKDAAQNL
jgi:Mor family transcriptional regulator